MAFIDFNEEYMKKCPICGGEFIHPTGVYVRVVKNGFPVLHSITADGYSELVFPTESFGDIRGVIIIREYCGECGHHWMEREQFHKGSVYTDWVRLPLAAGRENNIWRD